jgi:hypothetical protein
VTATSAVISWTNGGSESAWTIDYNGHTVNVDSNPYTLTGLTANTTYTVAVKARCTLNDMSEWSEAYTFTTASVGIDDVDALKVSVYPNPASRYLNLESAEGISNVTVYNALGQQVIARSVNAENVQLDLSSLAIGNYTLRIVSLNGKESTRKFIVNK